MGLRPPSARLVDATLLGAVVLVLASGVGSLLATPGEAWVVVVHGIVGIAFLAVLVVKLYRVAHRIPTGLRRGSVLVVVSLALAITAVAAVLSGFGWTSGIGAAPRFRGWTLLNLHIGIGLVLVPLFVIHLLYRFHRPRRSDWEGRRSTLQYLALLLGGTIVWRVSKVLGGGRGDPRFTGSRAEGGRGNDFQVTSWVLDDPDPIDGAAWRLHVTGAVDEVLELAYDDLPSIDGSDPQRAVAMDEQDAILDCTSGWYADRSWQGIRTGDLLDHAGLHQDASWVTFHAVTGYRFGFPIEEAREVLLATHVGGERLTHGHGFPLRVVAPGRRGYQWVKWVTAVEVRRTRDIGQWIAIFVSGFD